MSQQRTLLLDLEETIIPVFGDWFVPSPYADNIKTVVEKFKPHKIELFSWAIYNQADVDKFNEHRAYIESELDLTFNCIHDIASLITLYNRSTSVKIIDTLDFFDFVTKERFLFDMAVKAKHYPNEHLLLLDDAVSSHRIVKADTNTVIDVVNTADNLSLISF